MNVSPMVSTLLCPPCCPSAAAESPSSAPRWLRLATVTEMPSTIGAMAQLGNEEEEDGPGKEAEEKNSSFYVVQRVVFFK